MGTFPPFLRNIGTLSAFIMGASLTYDSIPMICIGIPIVFALVFTLIPNTPRYHLAKGDENVSLNYYFEDKEVSHENPFRRKPSVHLNITKATNEVAKKKIWHFTRNSKV